jgi:Kef-type K+ transport system membrane component KefB
MSFATLAVISAVALLGPLVALPRRVRVPVVVGELAAGIACGPTGVNVLHAGDRTFAFLADVGFALVMFVAGSQVPVRDPRLRTALRVGALRALGAGALSVPVAVLIAGLFGTGHAALYAVLLASSSAALVLPVVGALRLDSPAVLQLLAQVAIADTACIVALPLAVDPRHAGRAALGALAVLGGAAVLYAVLRYLESAGYRRRTHRVSEDRQFALELRINLMLLFALAALAVRTHVSVLLAGFAFGLAVAAVGEPRRLARQLFAVTEGFLGPLFFVWLGASLDLRELARHPAVSLLGLALGAGAVAVHAALRLTGQPLALAGLAAAQLGVPVAAATIGSELHLLGPGEAAALILGALVTVAAAAFYAARLRRDGGEHVKDRRGREEPPDTAATVRR